MFSFDATLESTNVLLVFPANKRKMSYIRLYFLFICYKATKSNYNQVFVFIKKALE